ncbi:MAG: ROK family protein [Ekhidna sp.]
MKNYIGIDIGGTNTTIGLVSEQGKIQDQAQLKIADFSTDPIEVFIQELFNQIKQLKTKNGCEIEGVGIGAPNGNFHNGTIELAPNMPWKAIHPIAEPLQELLGCPVVLTNDANAGALGEKQFGVAKGMNDFIFITLGTGLGSGIMSAGQIVYGHDGFAGEMGHSIVVPNGRGCTCGRRGCLEAYVSLRGVKETYRDLGGREDLTPKQITEQAFRGGQICKEVYAKTGEWLGLKLADAATYTSPEAYIFFGGIAEASNLFFPTLKDTMEANIHNLYRDKIKLMKSGLPLNDAAVLGAAALIMN